MFAMVKFFIKYESCSVKEPTFLAIGHPILCNSYNPKIHINRVTYFSLEEIVVLNIQDICTNCLYVNVAAEGRQEEAKKERD